MIRSIDSKFGAFGFGRQRVAGIRASGDARVDRGSRSGGCRAPRRTRTGSALFEPHRAREHTRVLFRIGRRRVAEIDALRLERGADERAPDLHEAAERFLDEERLDVGFEEDVGRADRQRACIRRHVEAQQRPCGAAVPSRPRSPPSASGVSIAQPAKADRRDRLARAEFGPSARPSAISSARRIIVLAGARKSGTTDSTGPRRVSRSSRHNRVGSMPSSPCLREAPQQMDRQIRRRITVGSSMDAPYFFHGLYSSRPAGNPVPPRPRLPTSRAAPRQK